MGKHDNGEDGSQVEVIMPDGFGSSFSTQQIRAKVFREFLVSHGTNPFFSDIGYLAPGLHRTKKQFYFMKVQNQKSISKAACLLDR